MFGLVRLWFAATLSVKLADIINLLVALVVFGVVMATEIAKRVEPRERIQLGRRLCKHWQNHWRHWRRIGFRVAFLLSLAANIVQIWGPPWPTDPMFFAGPYSFDAPFDALFIVQNRSVFFSIRRPQFFCIPLSVHTEDGRLNLSGENALMGTGAQNGDIAADSTAPFRFVLSQFHFPGTRLKDAQIRLVIEYDSTIPFRGRVRVVSDPFTLDMKLVPPQWVKGKILR